MFTYICRAHFTGSLKMIWELKGALWSDIPPYERATKLHEKYGKVFRSYYSWLLRQGNNISAPFSGHHMLPNLVS